MKAVLLVEGSRYGEHPNFWFLKQQKSSLPDYAVDPYACGANGRQPKWTLCNRTNYVAAQSRPVRRLYLNQVFKPHTVVSSQIRRGTMKVETEHVHTQFIELWIDF